MKEEDNSLSGKYQQPCRKEDKVSTQKQGTLRMNGKQETEETEALPPFWSSLEISLLLKPPGIRPSGGLVSSCNVGKIIRYVWLCRLRNARTHW